MKGRVCKFVPSAFEVAVVRLHLPVCLAAEFVMAQVQLHWTLHLHAVQGHCWLQLSLAVRRVAHWFVRTVVTARVVAYHNGCQFLYVAGTVAGWRRPFRPRLVVQFPLGLRGALWRQVQPLPRVGLLVCEVLFLVCVLLIARFLLLAK